MKKILVFLVLTVTMSFGMMAQRSDYFFNDDNDEMYNRMSDPNGFLNMPSKPLGSEVNESAPLGDGLLILTAIGLGYAINKRKKE